MSGIFDFIRKQPTNANPNQADPNGQLGQSAVTIGPVVVSEQVVQQPPQQTSYNGIGSPPNGQSFNGIGTPSAPPIEVVQQPVVEPIPVQVTPSQNVFQTNDVSPIAEKKLDPMQDTQNEVRPQDMQSNNQTSNSNNTNNNQPKNSQNNQGNNNQNQQNSQPKQNTPQQNNQKPANSNQTSNNNNQNPNANNQAKAGQNDPKNANPAAKPQDAKPAGNALTSNLDAQKRGDLDVMTHLTQRSNRVFVSANSKARELQNTFVDSEHLLFALLTDGEIYKLLVDLKVQPQIIEQELVKVYKKESSAKPPQLSPRVKLIIDNSLVIARKMGYEFISPEHLLLALFEEGEGVGARVLVKLGVKKEDINKKVTGKKEGVDAAGGDAAKQTEKKKSALEQFTVDLTAKAAAGELDPVVERSEVVERVVHILSRRMKNNPALVGEPGVGKTAVVEGLAQRIIAKQVPESLLNKRILVLDLTGVIAGASHRGEFEERMKNIVEELKASKGQVIMFIDEMHTIVGAGGGGEGALDASNFLKPALSRAEVQLVGATTLTEYRKYVEKDPALERRFQTVVVPEPTEEAAIKMLKASRDKFEAFHKVKIPDDTIEAAVKLSKRYIGDRFLPDKAFDLMDEAAAAVRLPLLSLPEEIKSIEDRVAQLKQEIAEDEKRGEKVKARIIRSKMDDIQSKLNEKKDEYNMKKAQTTTAVSVEIVKDIIAKRTGVPVSKISSSETERLVKLEDVMHKRMIGQERAVTSVSQAVRRGRAGLKSNQRPIGSFVFLGPSGVGKTELAKTLAEILFGQEESMIRFDMTEFMEKHEVAKLLGPPPGYVGYEEGGKLTEAVRRNPYSVVLFDEVEKAHPDIFNILLQILDDGRLTDNKGRTISFKNTVVICTSNIGTKLIQEELLKNKGEISEPPALSTYTFSPQGREILTIGNKYFERDGIVVAELNTKLEKLANGEDANTKTTSSTDKKETSQSWKNGILMEYFAGQKLESQVPQVQTQAVDPNLQLDPNAPAPQAEYVNETNPKDLTFPILGYDTQAISSKGMEMVSRDNLLFYRNATIAKVWQLTNLIDYFKDQIVINALPDAPDEQLPTVKLKTHAFSPDGKEIVSYKDRYWTRTEGTNEWETGELRDYFLEQTVDQGTFPSSYWDIHTFSPQGREIIIVGNNIWFREQGQTQWKQQKLQDYFGNDFPLEKELESKQQVEDASDLKKYALIKEKVMNELLKFFRPELVNRFDEVIVFEPLKFAHMTQIVKLQLKALTKLLEEQELGFACTEPAMKEIVRSGFDPVFGARPLRRAIQKLVENPISELIIGKKVLPGDTISLDYDGENFLFNIERIEVSGKDASSQTKIASKKEAFICQVCANAFETEVVKNSTPICNKCASAKLTKSEMGGVLDKPEEKKPVEEVSPTPQPTAMQLPEETNSGNAMQAGV